MAEIKVIRPRNYADPDAYAEAIRQGTVNALGHVGLIGRSLVVEAITETIPRSPIDTGLMRQGIGWEVDQERMSVRIGPQPPVYDRTSVMELGRRPGARRPPFNAILDWVHRKQIALKFLMGRVRQQKKERLMEQKKGKGGAKLKFGKKAVRKEVEIDLAILIVRSIARKGIKGRFFFKRALALLKEQIPAIYQRHLNRALKLSSSETRGRS